MNYLSKPFSVQNPVQPGDINFDLSILNTLQSRYDANKAIVDNTIAQYESLRGLTDIDNEYIASQVSNIKNQVNQLGSLNLANNTSRDTILNNMKNIMKDGIVQDILVSKANYDNYNAEVNKLKEKHPEQYNNANYQFGLDQGGYYDYVQGKSKKLGSMAYNAFSDYKKKTSDAILELEKVKKDQKIQIRDNNGSIIETTKSGLTPAQIQMIASGSLDQNDHKQIEIDAWANSNRFTDTSILERSKEFFNTKSLELKVARTDLETKLKQGGSDKQKAEWNSELNSKIAEQEKIKGVTSSVKLSAVYLQEQNAIAEAVNKFSPLYVESQEIKADEVYWNNVNYNLKVKELELKQEEFKYKIEKDKKDEELAGGGRLHTITTETVTEDNVDSYEKQIDTKITSIKDQITPAVSSYKDSIEQLAGQGNEEARNVLDAYELNLKSKGKDEDDLDVFRRTVLAKVSNKSDLAIIGNKAYLSEIKDNFDKYNMYVTARTEAINQGTVEHVKATLDNDNTYKAFFNNPDTKMLWRNANGREGAFSVREVLQNNGLMDESGNKIKGKSLTDPKYKNILNNLKLSYYADAAISREDDRGNYTENSAKHIRDIAKILGESDVVTKTEVSSGAKEGIKEVYRVNPNSKTAQFLNKARTSGIYDTFGFSDQSLSSDDNTVASFLNSDYKKSIGYASSLQKYVDRLPENKVVAIPTSNKELHADLESYLTEYAQATGANFKPDADQGINIKTLEGDYVEISQNTKGKDDTFTPQTIKVLKRDLYTTYPTLANKVDFEGKMGEYSMSKIAGKKFVSEPVNYYDKTNTKQYEYATEVLIDKVQDPAQKLKMASFLNASDSKMYLKNTYSNYIQTTPAIAGFIDKAVQNSGDYAINMESSEGFKGSKLHLKLVETSTGNVVDVMTYQGGENVDIGELKKIIDNTPQILFGDFMNNMLQRQQRASQYGSFDESFEKMVKSLN